MAIPSSSGQHLSFPVSPARLTTVFQGWPYSEMALKAERLVNEEFKKELLAAVPTQHDLYVLSSQIDQRQRALKSPPTNLRRNFVSTLQFYSQQTEWKELKYLLVYRFELSASEIIDVAHFLYTATPMDQRQDTLMPMLKYCVFRLSAYEFLRPLTGDMSFSREEFLQLFDQATKIPEDSVWLAENKRELLAGMLYFLSKVLPAHEVSDLKRNHHISDEDIREFTSRPYYQAIL